MKNFEEWWDSEGGLLATLSLIPKIYRDDIKAIAEKSWKVALASSDQPSNKVDADLCSCHEFTPTVYIKGRRHCKSCGKPENEQD